VEGAIAAEAAPPVSIPEAPDRDELAERAVPLPPGYLQGGVTPWADLLINGRRIERASLFRDTLPVGEYRLRFERQGFVPIDTTVVVQSGETEQLVIRLTRGPS
jgi:hypothetical protein